MAWESTIKLASIPGYVLSNGSEFYFNSRQACDTYFESKVIGTYSYDNVSYIRITGGSVRIKGNADKIAYEGVNFIIFKNTNFGDRLFYANVIGDPVYVSPNVTELNYAMNDWLTYFDLLDFTKLSYIARRTFTKNDKKEDILGLPYEDIDIGEDYLVADSLFDYNGSDGDYSDNQFYYLLLTKELVPTGSSHVIQTTQKTKNVVKDNQVITFNSKNGVDSVLFGYIMNAKCLIALEEKGIFAEDCDLVNSLQMITLLPFGSEMFPSGITDIHTQITTSSNPNVGQTLPAGSLCYDQGKFGDLLKEVTIDGFGCQLNDYINKTILNNYEGEYSNEVNDSAIATYLYRYPYSLVGVYDFYNQPLTIRPESISRNNPLKPFTNKSLTLFKYGSIGSNPVLVYGIKGYGNVGVNTVYNQQIEDINSVYNVGNIQLNTINSILSLPIISNYLSSFLQSNQNQINATRLNLRDSLQTQINNAAASMQATALSIALNQRAAEIQANTAAQNSYLLAANSFNATNANIGVQSEQMSFELMKNQTNTSLGFLGGVLGGLGLGLTGNVGAGMATMIGAGTNFIAQTSINASQAGVNDLVTKTALTNNANLFAVNRATIENSRLAAIQVASLSARASSAQANATYANTMRSANTAYQTAIRSLNARLQDAKNVPDSVQSMGNNGSYFNMLNNRDMINISTKTLVPQVMQRLVDYFVRVGFLTNKNEKISDLLTNYDGLPGFYIQTVNANLTGKIPVEALKNIIAMFNSGIHFWQPDKYLNYDEMRGV